MTKTIVVTRHSALLTVLIERGLVQPNTPVLQHVTASDVTGNHVIGVLPLALAALTESLTEVTLDLPQELRGKELTAEQVRQYMTGITTYKVTKL